MNRTAASYYRDEQSRLSDRMLDVERETRENRARFVELQREHALLAELIGALDAHVPDAETATDLPRQTTLREIA